MGANGSAWRRRVRSYRSPRMTDDSIFAATQRSVAAAEGLVGLDAGAVAVLLELARQIDYLAANGGLREDGKLDNVSIPTYLKFCNELGLTPAGREKLKPKEQAVGGKLAQLRSVKGGKAG